MQSHSLDGWCGGLILVAILFARYIIQVSIPASPILPSFSPPDITFATWARCSALRTLTFILLTTYPPLPFSLPFSLEQAVSGPYDRLVVPEKPTHPFNYFP